MQWAVKTVVAFSDEARTLENFLHPEAISRSLRDADERNNTSFPPSFIKQTEIVPAID